MKLSMWILANQLAFLDPEIHIRPDSPPILRSARRAYATNCVYVYQDGDDCVCAWEEDTIRLNDIPVTEAAELVQSVFDTLDDWYARISGAADARDYQRMIDQCYQIFKSPVSLVDSNYRVLGISRQFGPDDVDEEWQYLKTYGCSSISSLRRIRQSSSQTYMIPNVVHFSFTDVCMKGRGLTIAIICGNRQLGRLVVLEKDRPLNRGDMQMMEVVAALLRPCLSGYAAESHSSAPYLDKLLTGGTLSDEELLQLSGTCGWKTDHSYQLFLLSPQNAAALQPAERASINRTILLSLYHTFPEDQCGIWGDFAVLLANNTLMDADVRLSQLRALAQLNEIRLSYSLPARGLERTSILMDQALSALRFGAMRNPDSAEDNFYQFGIDYLISGDHSPEERVLACQPDVLALYRRASGGDDSLYETLRIYLMQERSVQDTANLLFIHKNTLLYRLRKLKELLRYDLEDAYTREYMRFSCYVLNFTQPMEPSVPAASAAGR